MNAPLLRLPLVLTSISLVNGMLLAVVHHHRHDAPQSVSACRGIVGSGGEGCGHHDPVRQDGSTPPDRPTPQPDNCPICHFLAQQPVVLEFASGLAPLVHVDRVDADDCRSPEKSPISVYDGRGPPV